MDRRSFLKTAIGSSVAFNAIGADIFSISPQPDSALQSTAGNKELGHIIDTHIHLVRGNPDLKPIGDYGSRMTDVSDELKAEYLKREMQQAGIKIAFGMGHRNGAKDDPLGIASTLRIAARVPEVRAIGVIDPTKTRREHLLAVERQIERERNKLNRSTPRLVQRITMSRRDNVIIAQRFIAGEANRRTSQSRRDG